VRPSFSLYRCQCRPAPDLAPTVVYSYRLPGCGDKRDIQLPKEIFNVTEKF
jgi:hypothetical protein